MNSRILPFLGLVLSVVIFFGYTNPLFSGSIAAHKAQIVSDNSALAAAANYQQKAAELTAAQNDLDQTALARVGVMLPDSVDNVGMILDLNSLAARTGVQLSAINVQASGSDTSATQGDSTSPVASVDLSMTAQGTYASFFAFLKGIETSERLLDVTNLVVSGSDTGVYQYQLTARLYWLR